ncbi:hypothetical protein TrRE_jg1096, partial [Triparma retinervis]
MYPFFFLVGLLALGMGMTLATVPTRISTAFAISSNSNSSISCVNRDQDTCLNSNKQDFDPCGDASDHAQDVTALSDSVKNLLTFFSAGLLGEISDIRGRKPVLVLAFVIQSLPSLAYFFILFYLHQVQDSTSLSTPSDYATLGSLPYIYYSLNAVTGIANFLTLVITCTADVLPAGPARAVAVGVILAIFFAGVSMAPLIVNSLIPSDVATAALSYLIIGVAVPLYACFGLKESLTPAVAFQAKLQREQKQGGAPDTLLTRLSAPFRSLTILLRNRLFKTLTLIIFLTTMANEATQTLLMYYLTDPPLCFTDADLASLMVIMGITGIIAQAGLLRPLIRIFGERRLLMFSSLAGAVHCAMYAFAEDKGMIYASASMVCLTLFSF